MEGPDVELVRVLDAGGLVAERDADAGIELAHRKGLGHVVVRAAVERFDLTVL